MLLSVQIYIKLILKDKEEEGKEEEDKEEEEEKEW